MIPPTALLTCTPLVHTRHAEGALRFRVRVLIVHPAELGGEATVTVEPLEGTGSVRVPVSCLVMDVYPQESNP